MTRENGYMGAIRSLPVSVNGHRLSLRNGRSAEIETSPRAIEICTAMDWAEPSCWVLTIPESAEHVEVRIWEKGVLDLTSLSQKQYTATIGDARGDDAATLEEVEFGWLRNPVDLCDDNKVRDGFLLVATLLGAVAWLSALYQLSRGDDASNWVIASGVIGFASVLWFGGRLYSNRLNVERSGARL